MRSAASRHSVSHYFSRQPAVPSRRREIHTRLRGAEWIFLTDRGVFAQKGIDPGTRLLIEAMRVEPADEVLDVGCGYGPIGLVAAHLATDGRAVLVDINERAVRLTQENARLAVLSNVEVYAGDGTAPVRGRRFDVAVMNPPIRTGRAVLRRLVAEVDDALRPGGRFYFVVRTTQGARTLARGVEAHFPSVREIARGGGYRVYEATKTN